MLRPQCQLSSKAVIWASLSIAGFKFAEEDVVAAVGVEGRVEVDEVDGGVGEVVGVAQEGEVVAVEEGVETWRLLKLPEQAINGISCGKGVSGAIEPLYTCDMENSTEPPYGFFRYQVNA